MPVPASINDLSTTAGSNSPPGSESPEVIDNYLRSHASFIAQLRDGKLPSASVSAFMLTVNDDVDAATARATLGANNATNLTTGTLPDARISNSGVQTPTLVNGFTTGTYGSRYWKIGGIVYVLIAATSPTNPASGTEIFTLAAGYRPQFALEAPGFYVISSPLSIGPMRFRAGTGGVVIVDIAGNTAGTTYAVSGAFAFPAA